MLSRSPGVTQECFQLELDAGLDVQRVNLVQAQAVVDWYCKWYGVPACKVVSNPREVIRNLGSYCQNIITLWPRGVQLRTVIHEVAHHLSYHLPPLSHCHDAAFQFWHKQVLLKYGLEVFELVRATAV